MESSVASKGIDDIRETTVVPPHRDMPSSKGAHQEVSLDVVDHQVGPGDESRGAALEALEARAQAHEDRIAARQKAQFQRLKDEAQTLYGVVDGVPGVRSPREWEKLLDRAGDEIGNGRFIVRCLGAERYLDALTVAVLITLRRSLIEEVGQPSTADVMRIDAAVLGYYNMLRVQAWIGNLSLVVERELFGQAPLNELHGLDAGKRLTEHLSRLAETMLPLLDRSSRMMLKALDGIRRSGNQPAAITDATATAGDRPSGSCGAPA